ncbi:MAG: hypothetical protein A2Z25_08170, partial [Planctomycetes bacterium RBG_16_55_9]
ILPAVKNKGNPAMLPDSPHRKSKIENDYMEIKYTSQGLLIYLTMAAYLAAFAATLLRRTRVGHVLFLAGFALSVVSYGYRWNHVRHAPLQNLFEVFLTLGMLCYPISWFCRRVLYIGRQWTDMVIGVIALFPAGFVFHAEPQHLPPALQSWLFVPHVAVYAFSYVFMFRAMFLAFEQLLTSPKVDSPFLPAEQSTYRLICVGFPLLTLGLILGSYWGKLAWGDYWGWDPKELWSLVSWLVYVAYFHVRYMFGKRHARLNSLLAIIGMVAIFITVTWVNLSRLFPGMHSYAS